MSAYHQKIFFRLLIVLSISAGTQYIVKCRPQDSADQNYRTRRQEMVAQQIVARGIRDQHVLKALRKVPRHLFVPPEYRKLAYTDRPLPIGQGQTISQPYIVALMTELLDLGGHEKVLEVGTGSGYQAAVLAEICDSVYTIEIFPELGHRAAALFDSLGYHNIQVKIGNGYQGWEKQSPFDRIIVTCAPSHIPTPLQEQLVIGGRMVIPVGERHLQQLVLLKKAQDQLSKKAVIPVRFVPMLEENKRPY